MTKNRSFLLAICLTAIFGGAYLTPSLANSFYAGQWELTPVPLGVPYVVLITLICAGALFAIMRSAVGMSKAGFGIGMVCVAAASIGTVMLGLVIAVCEYAVIPVDYKSIGDFFSMLSDVGPTLIVPSMLLAVTMAIIGITVGVRAFSSGSASGGDGSFSGGVGMRRGKLGELFFRLFRIPDVHRRAGLTS